MKRELRVLEYELDGLKSTLDPRLIEALVLAHPGGDFVSDSHISDKTADIAVEHFDSQRNARYQALQRAIHAISSEVRRLEYYLSLLPPVESGAIWRFYFEGLSWEEIAQKAAVSYKTAQRRRKRGLDSLVRFYSFMDTLPAHAGVMRATPGYISHAHEERYCEGLSRLREDLHTPGLCAMLYVISGCDELWNTGPDTFLNFETGNMISQEAITESYTIQGVALLRLAYCYAHGLSSHNLSHILTSYFSGLKHPNLALAIEGMELALSHGI